MPGLQHYILYSDENGEEESGLFRDNGGGDSSSGVTSDTTLAETIPAISHNALPEPTLALKSNFPLLSRGL